MATFIRCDGKANTLGDIKIAAAGATAVTFANAELQFLNNDGDNDVVSEATMGSFSPAALAMYPDSDLTFRYVPDTGKWYLADDSATKKRNFEMNDYPVPYGQGMLLFCKAGLTTGGKLNYNGQVKSGASYSADCPKAHYCFTGNVAPKDMTLGDFRIEAAGSTAVTFANAELQFLNADGDNDIVSEDTIMQTFCPEAVTTYGDSDLSFRYVPDTGKWYLADDSATKKRSYEMNNYPIKAGRAFLLFCKAGLTTGGKVYLPSAL